MALRKVVAFIGLLGVISALAWQHGLFDRADAAAPEVHSQAPAPPQKAENKSATKRLHSKR
ncbi:MAG: hypothetical protein JSR66_23235 [Proteobacteria bacterium]|nr:hypothetical protein [Pseudomonadota bacterium]